MVTKGRTLEQLEEVFDVKNPAHASIKTIKVALMIDGDAQIVDRKRRRSIVISKQPTRLTHEAKARRVWRMARE